MARPRRIHTGFPRAQSLVRCIRVCSEPTCSWRNARTRMLYFEPNFVDEALVLLDRFGGAASILAGGTRLGFRLRQNPSATTALVNLKRISELQAITQTSGAVRIGALATADQLARHPAVRKYAGVLAAAAQSLGARQLRSVATVGGNVCSGEPVADLTTALLACGARCEVVSSQEGPVQIALEELVSRPAPVLAAGELLSALEIPIVDGLRCSYEKMTVRRSFELALVAVAVTVQFQAEKVSDARIALAGAAAMPLRATHAESTLAGAVLDEASITRAARAAAETDARPYDDHRASTEYRRHLIRVLTERALRNLRPDSAAASADGRS